tara:strand:+ start:818 stop:1177 length:360 start_codon:yes stop_codon:yes gene_type:complete
MEDIPAKIFQKSVKKHADKSKTTDNLTRDVVVADKYCVPRETYHTYLGIRKILKECSYETLEGSLELGKLGKKETFLRNILIPFMTHNDPKQYFLNDLKGLVMQQEEFILYARKTSRSH